MNAKCKYLPVICAGCGLILILFGYLLGAYVIEPSGLMIGFGFLIMFYSLPMASVALCDVRRIWKNLHKWEFLAIGIGVLVASLFVFEKAVNERFVYYWDYSAYWVDSIEFRNSLLSTPREAVKYLFASINSAEYNKLPALLMSIPLTILGDSRVSYIFSNWLFWALPAVFVFSVAFYNISDLKNGSYFSVLFLIILFVPAIAFPVLEGYVDAMALLMAAATMCLLVTAKLYRMSIYTDMLISFELIVCLLCRRYFGYFVFGFALAYSMKAVIEVIMRGLKKKEIINAITNLLLTGVFSIGILLGGFSGLVKMSLFNNYSEAYQAYNSGFANSFNSLVNYFGFVILLLAAIGVIILTVKRSTRSLGISVAAGFIITVVSFFRTQGMGVQHYYVIVPYLGCCIVSVFILTCKASMNLKKCLLISVTLVMATNWLCGFGNASNLPIARCFTQYRLQDRNRSDIGVLQRMVADIDELSTDGVYVCASSGILNDDIIRRVNMPTELESLETILPVSHVDMRDGFPVSFLEADSIVATEPAQTHLIVEGQRVITVLNQAMLDDTPISACFERVSSYKLDSGVTAYLFKRIKEYDVDELEWLKNQFDEYYGDYPDMFSDRITQRESEL